MKQLTSHQTNACNEAIKITADDPDAQYGNASHDYFLEWNGKTESGFCRCKFQRGPIAEVGVNGVTNEAPLAVLIDRMEGFQSGAFACADNEVALEHLLFAMEAFKQRTLARVARGVEGTNVV